MESTYRSLHSGHVSDRHRGRYFFVLLLAILTIMSLSFTIFFAYNCSLEQPIFPKLLFQSPSRSIFVLNVASQLTIFCLAELTMSVLEDLRWSFASSASGTSAYTFLALSRATNIVGVIFLIMRKGKRRMFRRDGHRLWGCQRFLRKLSAKLTKGYFSPCYELRWAFSSCQIYPSNLLTIRYINLQSRVRGLVHWTLQ